MVNSFNLTSTIGNISIQSLFGSGLTLDGGIGGFMSAAGGNISVTARANDLVLQGLMTYTTTATLVANDISQRIVVSNGSNSTAQVASFLNTSNVAFQGGSLTTFGAPGATWTLANQSGTYANLSGAGTGTVTLTGALNLAGANLAIIAGGDIDLTGLTSINLSSGAAGGSLTMLAGYTFSPNTGGLQVLDTTTTYNNFAPSTGGGNILGTTNINTSGGAGAAGNVLAIANGSISLGSITATGGTNGGNVKVIAEGSITVGNIDTTGSTPAASGAVTLANAIATLPVGFSITNGTATNAAGVAVGARVAGDMAFQNINAGAQIVSLYGALTAASDTMTGSGTITASSLELTTGAGVAQIGQASIGALSSVATGASNVSLINTGNLDLGTITGASQSLNVATTGQMTHSNLSPIQIGTLSVQADNFNFAGSTIGQVGVSDVTIVSTNTLSGSNLGTVGGAMVRLVQEASMTDPTITNGVTASNLVLITNGIGSNIGTSASNRFVLQANQPVVTAISNHGSVFLTTALPTTGTLTVAGYAGGVNGTLMYWVQVT